MRSTLPIAVASLFLAGGVAAQEGQAEAPPMVAVSYYQCAPDQVEPIVDGWSQTFQQLQDDGVILGWGVLEHAWADEWNLILYRTVTDLAGLQASMEAQGEVMEAVAPDQQARMQEACSGAHKDNIYWLVAAGESGGG